MIERTQEESKRLESIVDGLPAWKLLQHMETALDGNPKRVLELIGWAVVWGLTGEKSGSDLRRRLEAAGMNHTTSYRAAEDFRKIGNYLLEQEQRSFAVPELMRKMAHALSI